MSLQGLVLRVKAERLYVDLQSSDRVGDVKIPQDRWVDNPKLADPLALEKHLCMSSGKEAGRIGLLPAVATLEQVLLFGQPVRRELC